VFDGRWKFPFAAVALVAAAGTTALAGCGTKAAHSLDQRELVIYFSTKATKADVARVRKDCDGAGGLHAEPPGKDTAVNRHYPLRFDASGSTDKQRTALINCLNKDKMVEGYRDTANDSG
jgi:hypothetical protein